MATTTTTRASYGFKDALGVSMTKSFNYVDPAATDAKLQAVTTAILANKEIYPSQPVMATSIKLITTTTKDVDLPA